jgi:hypothetical protein
MNHVPDYLKNSHYYSTKIANKEINGNYVIQLRCESCPNKTTQYCKGCSNSVEGNFKSYCHVAGRTCFVDHVHDLSNRVACEDGATV